MEAIGILLGVLTIALSLWIALRQHKQLLQLAKIGTETHETARKLRADTNAREVVSKFFSLGEERPQQYRCVFPVYYDKRPLPFIVAGDYYALHVLQNLIGSDRLELRPVTVNPPKQNVPVSDECVQGDVIYLCTPQANPALASLAPAVLLGGSPEPDTPQFGGVKLPCWFADYGRDAPSTNENPLDGMLTKQIWIPELHHPLQSPAENEYKRARELKRGEVHSPLSDIQLDYAILLRLTQANRKAFVLAGIHQYGTWIGGDFFRRLAEGEEFPYRDVFVSEDDFVAIIEGEFNSKLFKVARCDVLQQYVWVRKDDFWRRVTAGARAAPSSINAQGPTASSLPATSRSIFGAALRKLFG